MDQHFFAHEKLHVYGKAVTCSRLLGAMIDGWTSQWSVRGQLDRAVESMITNLARAARHQRAGKGIYLLECSLGSVMECAACLDVATSRGLTNPGEARAAKLVLQEVARMEVGLRRSWSGRACVRDDEAEYGAADSMYFDHESLDVYQWSLQIHESLRDTLFGDRGAHRYVSRIDELSTSLTLNIAEGNGRFSMRDHATFADAAEEAATKLASYMDLAEAAWDEDMGRAKAQLRKVMAMLEGLRRYLGAEAKDKAGNRKE